MKIGILELQAYQARDVWGYLDAFWENKQYISVTTQAVSVWCRQMGHQVQYASYYGWGDPRATIPADLEVVFISSHTYLSPLAYALSRVFQKQGVRTVIGGAHAKAHPQDCLRFFDLVVLECDESLIADILHDRFEPGSVVSSEKPYEDVPSIEERLPEIRKSAFARRRPHPGSFIPMLASMGCPYDCDFCIDWDNPYRPLSKARLAADLEFVSRVLPKVKLVFHDPNFGVRFDEMMSIFESIPPQRRNPYGIESTLTNLRPERLARLRETNCLFVLPSVESWMGAYDKKLGVGKTDQRTKLDDLVEHFNTLQEYFSYVGTNFIFGLDSDAGDEPFETTKEFMRRTPFVWPVLHIPIPFGGNPMQAALLREGRILKHLPFMFYKVPHLSILLKNYDPISYYEKMTELFEFSASNELFKIRLGTSKHPLVTGLHYLQTATARRRQRAFQAILHRLLTDRGYLTFHTGESDLLPDYYVQAYNQKMGAYAELVPIEEVSHPILENGSKPPKIIH